MGGEDKEWSEQMHTDLQSPPFTFPFSTEADTKYHHLNVVYVSFP